MPDCIFCKIIKKEIPAAIIWEDDEHIAFLSIFPNTKGFTVVASKRHLPSYAFENDDNDLTGIICATKTVAKILDNYFDDVGRCGMFFEGYGVDHLHSKLFPMHGTGKSSGWKPAEKDLPEIFFEEYPGYLSSHNGKRADDKELQNMAEKIRTSYNN
jgi:diadenosine tetraphosphate (Ap4A) HIT family hydrolase